MKKAILMTLASLCACFFTVHGEITLAGIFGPHMVLQQQARARIWGWATPGARIDVKPAWSKKQVTARADSAGCWEVRLSTPEASTRPHTITVRGDGSEIIIDDVLIGEVWFCSGQSNMEMTLRGYRNQPVENAGPTIASAGRYPFIRVAQVKKDYAETPMPDVEAPWLTSTPENAIDFTAVGYFFARELSDLINVPVGIIDCSYQGTKLETWMSRERLAHYPDIDIEKERADTNIVFWHRANVMYNSMLYPLTGYTIRGFLWNQGCSNVDFPDLYPQRQRDFVDDLRTAWADSLLPFLFVEIPGYHYTDPEADRAARFRESQHRAADITPRSAIVCTSDLVYPHEVWDIHASRKQEIGQRLAWLAGDMAYGIKGLPVDYPRYKDMTVQGDTAIISFTGAPNGFTPHNNLEGFEACGTDSVFHPAKAYVNYHTLCVEVIRPDDVDRIIDVRYNFKNFAIGRVHNLIGLPLIPFRTDNR